MSAAHRLDVEDGYAAARQEARVHGEFWPKLRRFAAQLPFAEDLVGAYFCAFDRNTPRPVRLALIGAPRYFVLPFGFIPDLLPLVGLSDDAAVLAHRDWAGCGSYHSAPSPSRAPHPCARCRTRRRESRGRIWATEDPLRGSSAPRRVDCRILPHAGDIHRVKVTTITSLMNDRDFLI